jgi:acyl-CoA thioester hydrolase
VSATSEGRPPGETRDAYPHSLSIATRWMDNDAYGHVNNVVYYSFFDTVVNRWLVDNAALDIASSDVIGVVAETMCRFRASVAFPDSVDAGLRVAHVGKSSVRYEIGIFRAGDDFAVASGYFVHVYVDRATRRPVPVPAAMRDALAKLSRVS